MPVVRAGITFFPAETNSALKLSKNKCLLTGSVQSKRIILIKLNSVMGNTQAFLYFSFGI